VWFTPLPASYQSTTAHVVERQLLGTGCHPDVPHGDNIRQRVSSTLGFSAAERNERLRRIAELAKPLYDARMIVHCAFIEFYCKRPVEICAAVVIGSLQRLGAIDRDIESRALRRNWSTA